MAGVCPNTGKAWIVDVLDGTLSPGTHYIGSGTGASAYNSASTTISTEVSEARVSATKSQPAADTNQWQGTQTFTGSKTVTNYAVLTASSGGTLIVGVDGASVAVANLDAIQFTVTLQFV